MQNKSSRFFENQPNDICIHLSEKASKGRFLEPEKLENHSNEGKGKEKKKERGEEKEEKRKKQWLYTLSFYKKLLDAKGLFSNNVIKNPSRNRILLKVNHVPIKFNMSNFNFVSSGLKEEGILRVPGNAGRIKVKNPSFFFLDLKVEITYEKE